MLHVRYRMQPDPMEDYILTTESGSQLLGRWLVGNTYEGWYIKGYFDDEGTLHECRHVYSQKELNVSRFQPFNMMGNEKPYIPKEILDESFHHLAAVEDFRGTPEMGQYL